MNWRAQTAKVLLPLGLTLLGVFAAFLASSVLILFIGKNPLTAFWALFVGAFGSADRWAETIVKTCPLLLIGVAVSVAFRARVWNIGAEGQLYMGALASTAFMLYLPFDAPAMLMVPLAFVAGFVGGALFSLIPAVLRAYYNINEIIATTVRPGFHLPKMTAVNAINPLPAVISSTNIFMWPSDSIEPPSAESMPPSPVQM